MEQVIKNRVALSLGTFVIELESAYALIEHLKAENRELVQKLSLTSGAMPEEAVAPVRGPNTPD